MSIHTAMGHLERTPVCTTIASARRKLPVEDYSITAVRWNREFCRLEADVTLTFCARGLSRPKVHTIKTSVAVLSHARKGSLRARLLRNALDLAILMPFSPKGVSSAA
ncbi:hypothetical protein [Profundibacterium mesophilum]|uniref:Uncharacterized protein n=1 Tax=Profundibacterium mesophilum KAUST100406-0324 TaxID=1037889 RepID=A0A921NTN7_9RHOB|nr:hypothetical protein [Profundibacterium mesophilum]KAF0676414.1 hypothetical protein PMES_01145 [Profundibacterium mesophilum KAUST100406-0324]